MISERYIRDLLLILKAHGVKHIKMQGLELTFHVEHPAAESSNGRTSDFGSENAGSNPASASKENQGYDSLVSTIRKQEESLPPDLRIESINNQETILNWSSPDQKPFEEEPEVPLTGEAAL